MCHPEGKSTFIVKVTQRHTTYTALDVGVSVVKKKKAVITIWIVQMQLAQTCELSLSDSLESRRGPVRRRKDFGSSILLLSTAVTVTLATLFF